MILWFAAAAATFAGGFVQSLAGFGFLAVAMPLLTLALDLRTSVPLVMLIGLALNLGLLRSIGRQALWREVAHLAAWTLPGVMLGTVLLREAPEEPLHALLGVVLLTFAAFRLRNPHLTMQPSALTRMATGFIGGILGGAIGVMGPPVVIYVMLQKWSKETARATLIGYFIFSNTVVASYQALMGLTTLRVLTLFAFCLPVVLGGMYAGAKCWGHVNETLFRRMVLGLVIVLGLMELWKGLA